jgi:hypothetical protein
MGGSVMTHEKDSSSGARDAGGNFKKASPTLPPSTQGSVEREEFGGIRDAI